MVIKIVFSYRFIIKKKNMFILTLLYVDFMFFVY